MAMRFAGILTLACLAVGCARERVPEAGDAHDHPVPERLGQVRFDTSCHPEVQADFNRGVALLHSFAFSSAQEAMDGVLARDPECTMAHWVQAMSHWGNPFAGLKPPAAVASGRAAVERGLATGSPTERERAYLEAAAELFRDGLDQRTRTLAYERAMADLHARFPDDPEAATFYALAINQTALPTDKSYTQQLKAAAILEPLLDEQPEHPGLAHYLIHAYDHPPLAERGLDAARRYADIAPSAPHALHMPSHTFTRVGLWRESVESNIASAAAAERERSYVEVLHAMDYQVYAYLQMAQDADARRVVGDAPAWLARVDESLVRGAAPPPAGLYAAAAIPARYAMERGAWAEAAALEVRPSPTPYADAITHFARAVGAARSGQPQAGRADIARLGELAGALRQAGDDYWAEQVDIQRQVATAWVDFAEGRQAEAVAALRLAADVEDATDKSAISPGPLAPARELLGEMLLDLDRPADALREFEAVMQKEPNRFRATMQGARAAARAGDTDRARTYAAAVLDIAAGGDDGARPDLAEARAIRDGR
jgi:hypothetical protein